ncbi:hypothetical protein [Bacillus sp. GB_SG_008]|uniref:hypothetical protein n=1 Tax=Bacillus sp. GB_SG_008 TaxID=3454627 RepID=UPI003F84B51C
MIKVIYFDEGTAMDYLDIKYGGKFNSIEEKMDEHAKKALAKMDAQVGASLKFFQVFKSSLKF